jgi:demethylmenaquinone methyltransferase/2-methoxy-6-polyprenyl-1,4-benzoquinol methylase
MLRDEAPPKEQYMAVQHPQSEARIAVMFDRIAPRYDLLNRLLSARQDQRWRKRLVTMVPHRPGGAFLDVATGTGDVLLAVAKGHPEYRSFEGVDISKEMLELAKIKTADRGLSEKSQYELQSAESLSGKDSQYDAVSISFGLRNVVNRDRALREFFRVLKPGGTLLILEFFIPKTGLMGALFQLYFHHILPFIGGILSDRAAYKYLPESVGSFYSPEALQKALSESGFKQTNFTNFLFGACRLVRSIKPN